MLCYTIICNRDLPSRVEAVNLLFKHAEKIVNYYRGLLNEFKGNKLINQDGTFTKKWQKVFDNAQMNLPEGISIRFDKGYSKCLYLEIRANVCLNDVWGSFSNNFFICETDNNGIVTEIGKNSVYEAKTFTVEDIKAAEKKANELLEEVKKSIDGYHFFLAVR